MATTEFVSTRMEKSFSVLEFYQNKTILITGVTGFVAKVLLEKILRHFQTVKRIYVLIRSKSSKTSQQRFNDLFVSSPILKSHQNKMYLVKAINGDITITDLGLSLNDKKKLINEVEVVFHSAATVKLNGIWKEFLEKNIRGSEEILKLCQQMIKLKSIVFVSTAYSNSHVKEIEEKIYPVIEDEDFEIYFDDLKKNCSEMVFKIGDKRLAGRPNPYALSKSIVEWMIKEYYQSLPVIICRPSIVGHSFKEPMPGWCESSSGYLGILTAACTGLIRTVICSDKLKSGIIPVDFVSDSLLIAGAYRNSPLYTDDKKVLNLTMDPNTLIWAELVKAINTLSIPSMKMIRPISFHANKFQTINDKIQFKLKTLFSHYLFALFFDILYWIIGRKPFLLSFMKKTQIVNESLRYFSCNEWNFINENKYHMFGLVKKEEQTLFNMNVWSVNWYDYFFNALLGTRRYQYNDPDSTIEKARYRAICIKIIYQIVLLAAYLFVFFIIHSICSLMNIYVGWNLFPFDLMIYVFITYCAISTFDLL